MKNKVTMRDISEKLGVSVVTVSKALNDKDGVSEELKEKIKQLAREMGYRYNSLARSMKDGLAYNIGIIIPEKFTINGIDRSFYFQFYQKITEMLEPHEYCGILHILSAKDEQNLRLPHIYEQKKVDGFIVLGQISDDYIRLMESIQMPFVFLDFYTMRSECDSVISDNYFGAYELTNYLIEKGHRNIAFVGNIYATSSIQDRFLGYYKSLLEHQIKLDERFVIPDRDAQGEFIEFELPQTMPTAFVCNCDKVAYDLIRRLHAEGYTVPDAISVVGFDHDIYSKISDPPITTYEVDVVEMTRRAIQIVLQKIKEGNRKFGRVLVNGKIIHKASVSAPSPLRGA